MRTKRPNFKRSSSLQFISFFTLRLLQFRFQNTISHALRDIRSVFCASVRVVECRLRFLKPRTVCRAFGSSSSCAQAVGRNPAMEEACQKAPVGTWDSLPIDVQESILLRLEFAVLVRFRAVSKSAKEIVESNVFERLRAGTSGLELSYLPTPDPDLFKEYSVCGDGGLMCAEVSKLPKKGELVVFNPLTGQTRALPPLIHPRKPVLVHLAVDSATKRYKVIVAGSAAANDEHLSTKVEVYDSLTCKWTEVWDLPGPVFGLNEHQAGVCLNGVLFFIAFREDDYRRGVVAFDVENEQWLEKLACPIPWSPSSNTLQLVENDGQLYLFSEQERGATVEHCIDELELPNADGGDGGCRWRNVVRVKKSGGRGLLVYPEYACVSFGERKLCIFNTLSRDGVVNDERDGQKCELHSDPANQTGGFSTCIQKSRNLRILLLCLLLCLLLPTAGVHGEHQTLDLHHSHSTNVARSQPWFQAVLLVGLVLSMALFARWIYRHSRGRRRNINRNRFHVERGLKNTAIPTRSNPMFTIPPELATWNEFE